MSRRSLDSFKSWRQLTFQAASDVQQLADLAGRFEADDLVEEADALLVRFMERRFTLAVLGEFKRGKSTFINALLGAEVLPSDILPTTATVNRVTFGLRPSAELHFHDETREPQAIPVDALSETVTKLTEESGAVAATVREAVVSWPVRFCKNDVDIVDTPGLSDEAAMTTVTMRLLPKVDAAIFVVMADSPFSETEGRFLDEIFSAGVTRVVYVVNAIDRIRRVSDRARLLDAVRDRIRARVARHADQRFDEGAPERASFLAMHGDIQVHGVSALDALEGAESHDGELIAGSGMPDLEVALEKLLTESDQLGLLRRCEQVEVLAHRVREAGVATNAASPGGGRGTTRRLGVLLDALEPALERSRRDVTDVLRLAMNRVSEDVGDTWSGKFPRAVRAALAGCQDGFAAAWPAGYAAFAPQAAEAVVAAVEAFVAEVAHERLRSLTEARGAAVKDLATTLSGADHTLDFVAARLAEHDAAEGCRAGEDAAPPPDPDPVALGRGLSPPRDEIEAALADPALVALLLAESKRDGFSRFLSFDFASFPETWAAKCWPRLLPILQRHFDRCVPEAAIADWLGAAIHGASRPIDARVDRARRTRLAIHSLVERYDARHSSDLARRDQDLALVEGIAGRARRNAGLLRGEPAAG